MRQIRANCREVGCTGLLDAKPTVEATAVERIREEGAVLLGKTVLTEWADYRSPRTASGGWSPFDGQCLAPYCEDQDPSGSSSGSAVAVALGLAPFALAVEVSPFTVFICSFQEISL